MSWEMRRNELHATTANTFALCPRKFYYGFERGWVPDTEARALTFGKAWHRFLERLAGGEVNPLENMTEDPDMAALTPTEAATLIGLGTAFRELYTLPKMSSEIAFSARVKGTEWRVAGRVDGLTEDGRVVEYKTTASSVAPESDYWARLRFNLQVLIYASQVAQRAKTAAYFVLRKPSIKPTRVPLLDAEGRKIVIDLATGDRAIKRDGSPRTSGGEGFEVQTREETPDEFVTRLYTDAHARPDFYFAGREVPITAAAIEQAQLTLLTTVREVQAMRRLARATRRPENAWRRACSEMTCSWCPYRGLCLDIDYDCANGVPEGFAERGQTTTPNKEKDNA